MLERLAKLLIINPPPTSRTTARATSVMARRLRVRFRRNRPKPDEVNMPPSFKASIRSLRLKRSAGARPKRMPVTTETPRV